MKEIKEEPKGSFAFSTFIDVSPNPGYENISPNPALHQTNPNPGAETMVIEITDIPRISQFVSIDMDNLDAQIANALATYQQYVDDYNWGVQSGSAKYAKNTRLPRVEAAKAVLDNLRAQKEAMLSDMGKLQGIGLVDDVRNEATSKPETEIPWKTIGLAAAALVAIVIVVKVL